MAYFIFLCTMYVTAGSYTQELDKFVWYSTPGGAFAPLHLSCGYIYEYGSRGDVRGNKFQRGKSSEKIFHTRRTSVASSVDTLTSPSLLRSQPDIL